MIEVILLQNGDPSHHRVPSLDVFGSYFPAWLLSLAAGVVLTIVVSAAGNVLGIKAPGFLSPLLYVSLILIFSISVWFWLFAI
jgi:sterol desaturase/sphingolipid hydroxylase (fatty acid hydroxylase superfamily)